MTHCCPEERTGCGRPYVFLTFSIRNFPEYVKGYQAEFLQKLQVKAGIKGRPPVMQVPVRMEIRMKNAFKKRVVSIGERYKNVTFLYLSCDLPLLS